LNLRQQLTRSDKVRFRGHLYILRRSRSIVVAKVER
jgi:hypothetical protein